MLVWIALFLGVCAAVILSFIAFIFISYRVQARKRNSLFGSTIKSSPTEPVFESIPKKIQPRQKSATSESESVAEECDVEAVSSAGSEEKHQRGLSSSHSRWASGDRDVSMEVGGEAERGKWRLSFKLHFHPTANTLTLTVFRAKQYPQVYTACVETGIYVTTYLMPDEKVRQTAVYKNTGTPSFDEMFHFQLEGGEMASKWIRLSLYELDTERTRICLGHTVVHLGDLNLLSGSPNYLDKDLEQLAMALKEKVPEIHVSLNYHMQNEKMKIQKRYAYAVRGLAGHEYYLRTHVILGTRSVKTKKTERSGSLEGVFQFSYSFTVAPRHLDSCCLQFSVIQVIPQEKEHTPTEQLFGELIIGPCIYAHGSGLQHWKEMLANSRRTVDMWHKLSLAQDSSKSQH